MNHISTLTVTQQYIHNQATRVAKQQSDDILQILNAVVAAIDERFQANEADIRKVLDQVEQRNSKKAPEH